MSEQHTSGKTLALIAIAAAVAAGGYAAFEASRARQAAAAGVDKLGTLETAVERQQVAIETMQKELVSLKEQIADASSASELQKLAAELESLTAKTLHIDSLAQVLQPLQSHLQGLTPATLTQLTELGHALKGLDDTSTFTNLIASVSQMQSRIAAIGQQNNELARYVDQRIRALRTAAEAATADPAQQLKKAVDETAYRVQAGDTLEEIAREVGVSLRAILEANPNVDAKRLQIGQSIDVPVE